MSEETQKTENAAAPAAEAGAGEKPEAAIRVIAPQAKNSLESVERDLLAQQSNKDKFPAFTVGDTVRVSVKIVEGDKQRIQPFEGVVLAKKHGGPRESFTVRRVSYGVAIERVFPFHSPFIDSVEVVRKGKVRRAKLYYMRGRFGKSAVITEKVG